jgi:hypothetical protein
MSSRWINARNPFWFEPRLGTKARRPRAERKEGAPQSSTMKKI